MRADALDAVGHVKVAEGGHVLEEHLQVEMREELLHLGRVTARVRVGPPACAVDAPAWGLRA